ncbi:Serine/threonine-protein kinase HipA [compost metagenome]
MTNRASIYYKDIFAGMLIETDEGYEFIYDQDYIHQFPQKPVSLTLPVRAEPYKSKVLFPFFDGLIPEGWLLHIAEDYWKLKTNDRFELLITLCRDSIGAVSVIPVKE